jgi:nickel/cobalt transporter (NicO) family protein
VELSGVESRLVDLFDAPEALVLGLIIAIGVGAAHAVAPGHGKSITAAYLVAGRARPRDALALGAAVAAMHTLSVVVLAVVWVAMSAASTLATDLVTAWLRIAAAVGVTVVGAVLVRQRLGQRDHEHGHDHAHDHGHGPGHHDHHHPHGDAAVVTAIRDDEAAGRPSRGMLWALATSGGLLPSPSAFLVLVSGLLTGRVLYAASLVLAFAAGMAITLGVVGVATLRGRDLLVRRGVDGSLAAAWHRRLPVIGAVGVLGGGFVYLALAVLAVPI